MDPPHEGKPNGVRTCSRHGAGPMNLPGKESALEPSWVIPVKLPVVLHPLLHSYRGQIGAETHRSI